MLLKFNVSIRLYSDIVIDSLTEFAYDASLAGLDYNFTPHTNGLYVSMSGYNDKMSVLVKHVFEKVKSIEVKADRLAVMKEQVVAPPHYYFNWLNFRALPRQNGIAKTFSLGNHTHFQIIMADIS